MIYKEWKAILTDSHWSHIVEAIRMDDDEKMNPWLDDNYYLKDIIKHYGGNPEWAWNILDELSNLE